MQCHKHTTLISLSDAAWSRRALLLPLLVRRPERQVVAEQLHDERGVLVALLRQRVELTDSVVEGLLCQVARLGRFPQDFLTLTQTRDETLNLDRRTKQ